jgi:hypothetical protein
MTPKAADDLPFPWPVFSRTIDSARAITVDHRGRVTPDAHGTTTITGVAQGTRCNSGAVPQL